MMTARPRPIRRRPRCSRSQASWAPLSRCTSRICTGARARRSLSGAASADRGAGACVVSERPLDPGASDGAEHEPGAQRAAAAARTMDDDLWTLADRIAREPRDRRTALSQRYVWLALLFARPSSLLMAHERRWDRRRFALRGRLCDEGMADMSERNAAEQPRRLRASRIWVIDDLRQRFKPFPVPEEPMVQSFGTVEPRNCWNFGLPPRPDAEPQPLLRRLWDRAFARRDDSSCHSCSTQLKVEAIPAIV